MATSGVKVIGLEKLFKQLKTIPAKADRAIGMAITKEANFIMSDSKSNYVPVDTGALRNSGFVELPKRAGNKISVSLGYGGTAAKYAARVHENPRAGKTGGMSPSGSKYKTWSKVGQWKYLEIPFRKRMRGQAKRIKDAIKKVIK